MDRLGICYMRDHQKIHQRIPKAKGCIDSILNCSLVRLEDNDCQSQQDEVYDHDYEIGDRVSKKGSGCELKYPY